MARRMWATMWSQLDAAEETTLRAKYDIKQTILTALAPPSKEDATAGIIAKGPLDDEELKETGLHITGPISASSSHQALASLTTPPTMTRALTSRGLIGKRKDSLSSSEAKILDVDVYRNIKGPSAQFLSDLSMHQHIARQRYPMYAASKSHRDYEIAEVPFDLEDDTPITGEWIAAMVKQFKNERILSYKNAFQVARKALLTMIHEPNVVTLNIPSNENIAVVGDIHGQLDDLLMVFREAGHPGKGQRMLFNGDFVDRGKYSCECLLILLACRAAYPQLVHLNRGNHECADMNSVDGFQRECEAKYDTSLYNLFNYVFATMPIAHLVIAGQQRVFVVHAGLTYEDVTLADINAQDRFQIVFPMRSMLQDLLWSDPFDGIGFRVSKRGAGYQFGSDVAARFLVNNSVNLIIRSHECEDNGFALWFENRLYTIFSASDYCGDSDNYGAFCVLSDAPAPQIRVFMAKKQVLHYTERLSRVRKAIISKLLVRIVSAIQYIEIELTKASVRRGTPDFVSRVVWSHTLQHCLDMDAPFILLGEHLGADTSTPGALINITEWCKRFKPKYHDHDATDENDLRRHLSDLLFDPNSPFIEGLEALFAHFDENGDGSITYDEFKTGVNSLMNLLGKTYKDEDMVKLLDQVDKNKDGEVDYNEFFAAFAYGEVDVDAKL